ncbi:MAG TPA: hydrolase [Gammaproteobacteria bacterium]|nr:hydrolase [Gammaproteobacteria bacterium]
MIIDSQFKPATGLKNPHIQTLLPMLLRRKKLHGYIEQMFELKDGDFLDLLWTGKPASGQAIVVVFHGLEGDISSPYASGIMSAIKKRGWVGLLMHFRGCSGRLNRLARSYHSGETGDAKELLNFLANQYPESPVAAAGYSLGGNMLLKLQAELAENSVFKAVVSVCAPLELNNCALRMDQGFSKIYQRHLLKSLKKNTAIKAEMHNFKQLINLDHNRIKHLNNFREFDDALTAPLHGFRDVDDYYSQSSARQYLHKIKKPTLVIQAKDDPFMSSELLPEADELSFSTQLELSEHGGHVGFVGGNILQPFFWLESRIPEYFSQFI